MVVVNTAHAVTEFHTEIGAPLHPEDIPIRGCTIAKDRFRSICAVIVGDNPPDSVVGLQRRIHDRSVTHA